MEKRAAAVEKYNSDSKTQYPQEMPEDQESIDGIDEQRQQMLDTIGVMLAAKRKEAIEGKLQLGIEDDMQGDEEYYQGYDDANRHEFVKSSSTGRSIEGKTQQQNTNAKPSGSTVFPNITQPYVDAASARVGDVLLPTDDRNYSLSPTPIPDIGGVFQESGNEDPSQEKIEFDKLVAEADRKAKLAEDQIEDWLQETDYNTEMRKVIDDVVRLGSGIIKGPVPVMRRSSVMTHNEDGSIELTFKNELKPESYRVDPWNFFPDSSCGESIHNGSYTFERDYITSKELESFKEMEKDDGTAFYINSQIDKCIAEGPGKSKENNDRRDRDQVGTKNQYEIWYIYANIKAEEMIACGCEVDEKGSFNAVITMVNDNVIRAALNHFDTGEFPYDLIPWKRRPCMPWGMSLSRQLRTPQRIVVGATRRMMDNLGLASGPQFVVNRGVTPENGIWEIKPLKIWVQDDDAVSGATSPVQAVVIPTMQAELTATIQLGMKMAEEVTGMPMLMQGQQGSAPDTVGGMTILNNNANSILRRIARLFDGAGTVPHITRYYYYLMNYGKDDAMKGDFQVVARGSSALVERDIQSQEMVSVLQLCLNPAFGKDPKKAMDEYLKSRRFDAGAFDFTEDELKKLEEQPPQAPPQVQAAQIRVEGELKKLEVTNKTEEQRILAGGQIAKMKVDASAAQKDKEMAQDAQRDEVEQKLKLAELQLKQQNAAADHANKKGISLDKAKTVLATTGMKLNLQKELSNGKGGEVITPPIEPPQRAPDGQSFEQ